MFFFFSIIYFKWSDDDDLFWGFDLKFFEYDGLVDLLSYREVDKHRRSTSE